ncbi:MAG: hypothetical protein GC159_01275 [Phycisphaera sp.]|nr:hypothetical protein [Phycisphaera sp.]
MSRTQKPDPEADPFAPPDITTEVRCTQCGRIYESYLIQWAEQQVDGEVLGGWACPTAGCNGQGFGQDMVPTDPDYLAKQDAAFKDIRPDDSVF